MVAVALRHHLLSIPGVQQIVVERVYFQNAPPLVPGNVQQTNTQIPYVVFYRIGTPRDRHLRGATGLTSPRWQFTLYGFDATVLETLATAIRLGLDTKRNYDMGPVGSQVNVRSAILEDERDGYEAPVHGEQTGLYRKDLDFIIWHTETVPT